MPRLYHGVEDVQNYKILKTLETTTLSPPKLPLNKHPLSQKPLYLRWYRYSEVPIAGKIRVCSQIGLKQTLLTACSTMQTLI